MTDPSAPRPSGSIIAQTAANLQAAHPDIPPERLATKVGSALLGAFFLLAGVGVTIFGLHLLSHLLGHRTTDPTTGELVACGAVGAVGISLLVLGAAIADFEVVKNPIKLVVASIRGVSDAIRGRNGSPS